MSSPSAPVQAQAPAMGLSAAPVLAIVGPTASGKSGVALALAEAASRRGQRVELVTCDSAQVYQGMDIGTAKPTPAEQAAVPHHLLDRVPPEQHFSAARFVREAQAAIAEIRARGANPVLVGGTMLYLRALRGGLAALPAADPETRRQIDARAAQHGWPALHRELAAIDPETAARLAPNDAQRIQRALEVHALSGRTLSDWHREGRQQGRSPLGAAPTADSPVDADATDMDADAHTASPTQHVGAAEAPERSEATPLRLLSLEPLDRAWLHARIAERFAAMLEAGFIDEVRALRGRPGLTAELPSMRSVGYRQIWAALDEPDVGSRPWTQRLQASGIAATRQLAKRQLTWLRSMPERHVVAADAPEARDQAVAWALQHGLGRGP